MNVFCIEITYCYLNRLCDKVCSAAIGFTTGFLINEDE